MKKILFAISIFLISQNIVFSKEVQCPQIWGIAKVTYFVNDFQTVRDYYGRFLGFDEALSYESPLGKVISFKVNDRQFIEFIEKKTAPDKMHLVSVSLETENCEQMLNFLKIKGIADNDSIIIDGAGNKVFTVKDFSGIPIEFLEFTPNSLHKLTKGKFLSENRISKRIHHVGLYSKEVVDNDPFYIGILGCREVWRFPESKTENVKMHYLQLPYCCEYIEHYTPSDVNFNHVCFVVEDMQETIYTLKERRKNEKLARPMIGKGNRWLLNMRNSDGIKVEFTEIHTVR